MGRTINSILIFFGILISVTGCADFELYVKKEAQGVKPGIIIIGQFDIRNMNYDPYVPEEFKDALKMEFFKRGYNSISIQKCETSVLNEAESAAKLCRDNGGDLFIKGVISQRESGFLADRQVETLISFTIFGRNGSIIGEGFFHDNESAGSESLRRSAAEYFVSTLLKKMEQAD